MRKVALVILLVLLGLLPAAVHAQGGPGGGPIEVISSSVTSEFPGGMRFKLEVKSEKEITQIAVRFRVGQNSAGVYEYLTYENANLIDGELFWRTNTSARYIPPGTIITYNFEVKAVDGGILVTDTQKFIFHDARFTWAEVTDGPVTVAYHGPVKKRAELILQTVVDTFVSMGTLLGADNQTPVRVTMYNNAAEMLAALPPASTTIRSELITLGQAYEDEGVVLTLGGDRGAVGTAAHETVHILTHRAGDSIFRFIPQWLDEGLAEFGNPEPGYSYDIALDFAMETNQLLPITFTNRLPGDPQDAIIFYGQARSVVRFLVLVYGPANMKGLMAEMKGGLSIDDALLKVYGFDRLSLENQWREAIGAPEYIPVDVKAARPTPIPRPEITLYTLTPQPEAVGVAGMAPSPTPESVPMETATPIPTSAATSVAVAAVRQAETEPASVPVAESTSVTEPPGPSGGGCSAGPPGVARSLDVSSLALVLGLLGLGLRGRIRRR